MEMDKILWQCPGGWLWKSGHPQVFFPHLFFWISFSQNYIFCLPLLWLRTLESIWKGKRVRSMIYLEGNEIFGKFGSTHPLWRQDVLLAGAIPYLLSFTHVLLLHLYFCGSQKKRFILPSQKQAEVSVWRVFVLSDLSHEQWLHIIHLMEGCRITSQWDAQYRNDSSECCLCGWIECIGSNHKVFRQLLYSGYAGRYLYLSAWASFLVLFIYFWLMSWYPLPGNDATFGRQTRNSMEGHKNILIALKGMAYCLFVFICREKKMTCIPK